MADSPPQDPAHGHNHGQEEEEAVPMYSIQAQALPANVAIAQNLSAPLANIPYTTHEASTLNPCGEGLEKSLIPVDAEGARPAAALANPAVPVAARSEPGCCRRWSCCFPLVIVALVCLMMLSANTFEHCQDCLS